MVTGPVRSIIPLRLSSSIFYRAVGIASAIER